MRKIIVLASVVALMSTSCAVITPGVATGNVAEKTGFVSAKTFLGITFKPIDLSVAKAAKKSWDYKDCNHGLFRNIWNND